jgi:hypothetical protein
MLRDDEFGVTVGVERHVAVVEMRRGPNSEVAAAVGERRPARFTGR